MLLNGLCTEYCITVAVVDARLLISSLLKLGIDIELRGASAATSSMRSMRVIEPQA